MIATHTAWSSPPAIMMLVVPKRAIRWPVKKDGRNMPTMCHWITARRLAEGEPAIGIIASGVTVITKVMTA